MIWWLAAIPFELFLCFGGMFMIGMGCCIIMEWCPPLGFAAWMATIFPAFVGTIVLVMFTVNAALS